MYINKTYVYMLFEYEFHKRYQVLFLIRNIVIMILTINLL